MQAENYFPTIQNISQAKIRLNGITLHTPLQKNINLSEEFSANILLKREDLQLVRSYKLRGAYNKIAQLSEEERKKARLLSVSKYRKKKIFRGLYSGLKKTALFMSI